MQRRKKSIVLWLLGVGIAALIAAACWENPSGSTKYCDLVLGYGTRTACKNSSQKYKCASYHYNPETDLCEGERCTAGCGD